MKADKEDKKKSSVHTGTIVVPPIIETPNHHYDTQG